MRRVTKDRHGFILRVSSVFVALIGSATVLPASALTTNTAAAFLAVGSGSRPIALGEAYTAVSDDIFALNYNPAGLNRLRYGTVAFQHNEWGLDMRQEYMGTVVPTGAGMLGVSVEYMSYGTIPALDSSGNRTGTNMTPTDLALTAGLGFGNILPGLSAGAALNVFNEELIEKGTLGAAATFGCLYRWPRLSLDLGLSINHLGLPVAGCSLPTQLAVGAACRLWKDTVLLTVEGDVPLSDYPLEIKAGAEWKAFNVLALRAGYRIAPAEAEHTSYGLSAGAGVYFAPFSLSYSYQPLGALAQSHRITLEYDFIQAVKPARKPQAVSQTLSAPQRAVPLTPPAQPDAGRLPSKEALLQPSTQSLSPRPVNLTQEEKKRAVHAFLRGRDLYNQRQYDPAIEYFEKALSIYPDYAKARRALSWAKRDRARQMLEGSLRLSSQRGTADEARKLFQQGRELERKGKPVDAAFAYKSALRLMPEYDEARTALKQVQSQVRKTDTQPSVAPEKGNGGTAADIIKSKSVNRAAQEEVLSNLQTHRTPAKAESGEADESLAKAIQKHFLTGSQALDQGEYAQAIREFELILEFEPDNKQANYKLSVARTKAAEQVEAVKAQVKKARASGDNLGEANALRNLVLLDPSDSGARKAFNEAKNKSKTQINDLYKKGVTAYAQGNYADAIQIWNEVLDLEPGHEKAKDSIKKAREKLELTNE